MNIEMEIQNQLKISGTAAQTTTNEITSTTVKNVQGSWNRSLPSTNQFAKPTICPNCGYGWSWSASHRQKFPARGKNFKSCGIVNHFAKVCRNSKPSYKPKPRVNNVDDSVSESATTTAGTSSGYLYNSGQTSQ